MSHTQAPWNISEHSELPDRKFEITTPDSSIADVGTEADATLIWAAPDMLKALQAAIAAHSYIETCDMPEWLELAEEAVAKAT